MHSQLMDAFKTLFLVLSWVSIFQSSILVLNAYSMPATKCTHGGPDINSPFQIKGQHHPQYQKTPSESDFELLCKDNLTIIHFPSYGNLVVKSITYDLKRIDLVDPKYCIHQVFLNLDLSLTPFHYYYVLKNYSYINCSTSPSISPHLMEIPCLSGPNFHVFTVDPSLPLPESCKHIKTAAIPFEYSAYLSGNTLGLGLTWDSPESPHTKTLKHTVVSMGILCIFAVTTVMMIKVHWRKKEGEKTMHLLERLADL